ncbi:MAG: YiiX/YebB-like N1pC/P60 family cysteine hydrolase [Opitutales bacterium]|nr:YiiX/YebB-like N1pC/P60 family cysteine hydrolase [Opitutales bacterium]MDG2170949.1 YiiX/YebB-like N1pC/P60 family cysteine hydrolase [Opitutales bacterium]
MKDALQPDIPSIIDSARTQKGKAYDILYRFDNEEIYCSELMFNAVKSTTGIELGDIESLGDLNWKPFERTIIGIQGYVPHDREMITPVSLSRAEELFLVYPLPK